MALSNTCLLEKIIHKQIEDNKKIIQEHLPEQLLIYGLYFSDTVCTCDVTVYTTEICVYM